MTELAIASLGSINHGQWYTLMPPKIYIISFEYFPYPGGQATYAYELAWAFNRLEQNVFVIAPRYKEFNDDSEPYAIYRTINPGRLTLNSLLNIYMVLRRITENDIVIAADIYASFATTLIRPLVKFKKIAMYHGGEIKRAGESLYHKAIHYISSFYTVKRVVNSSYTAELVKRNLGKSSHITLLGVSRFWFEDTSQAFESETLRALGSSDIILCTVARLERRKGHLFAIQALCDLAERTGLNFKYVVCGKIVDQKYYEEMMAAAVKLHDRFIYCGALSKEDVRKLYSCSKLMILAAQETESIEGFGLVITEAAAQCCPSVATRVGGIVDAVIDGETGLLCSPTDLNQLSRSIECLLVEPELYAQMAKAANKFAKSLTWESTAIQTIDGI